MGLGGGVLGARRLLHTCAHLHACAQHGTDLLALRGLLLAQRRRLLLHPRLTIK